MVLAATLALAVSAASAGGCEPPQDATVLKQSHKVVVWKAGDKVKACARRTGRTRTLVELRRLRVARIFLPGERVVLAVRGDQFSEMALFRFGKSREPVLLSAGFGDVPELDRNHRGRFAWIETAGHDGACPCSVIAGDGHQRFVVARRKSGLSNLRIGSAAVAFDSREGSEQVHVPFVTPHGIAVRPDPGGPESAFRLVVTLPRIIPQGGRVRAEIDTQTVTGDDCNGKTTHGERQHVTRDGRKRHVTLTSRDGRWCVGSNSGLVTYFWNEHLRFCSIAHPNCAGSVEFGRFRFHVRNP